MATGYENLLQDRQDSNDKLDPASTSEDSEMTYDDNTSFHSHPNLVWPWKVATAFFAVMAAFLMLKDLPRSKSPRYSYETGFATDLAPARQVIEVVPVRFTGALKFNTSGELIREVEEGQLDWVGTPTDEIDAAWKRIEDATSVFLEGEEADTLRGTTRFKNGYWVTGFDVFHQIHCLNRLRKHMYPHRYPDSDPPRYHQLHLEHCIDSIRQALLCSADMTTLHVLWYPEAQRYALDFNAVHMCRNVDKLLNWSLARTRPTVRGSENGIEHGMKGHQ